LAFEKRLNSGNAYIRQTDFLQIIKNNRVYDKVLLTCSTTVFRNARVSLMTQSFYFGLFMTPLHQGTV